MSESPKYNSFSASDIERYHKGQMSAAERHALEKAALDDPFLADALEGYAFTSTPAEDLKAIKNRLEERLNRRKTVPLASKKYRWLQVAALFLVLAGSGWFAYHSGLFSKKEIATVPTAQKRTVETNPVPSLPDTPALVQTETASTQKE